MIPATFEMAFAHNRSELAKRMDLSNGLLQRLLDLDIINSIHYERIKVIAFAYTLFFFNSHTVTYYVSAPIGKEAF